jgi:protein-disulfide isomerase
MNKRIENVLNVALAVSAVAIALTVVTRAFAGNPAADRLPSPSDPPTFVDGWEELTPPGVLVGAADAPVKVVEFSDLQCPFCKRFHSSLKRAMAEGGGNVAYTFVHFPLSGHSQAMEAARAAQCAAEFGAFQTFIDAVFDKQELLGTRSIASFAADAGIGDTLSLLQCMGDSVRTAPVDQGRELGSRMNVSGTPTVIVNGWRFPTTPPDSQFNRVVQDLLAGRDPFPAARRRPWWSVLR